jgi:DNA-binding transcriptional ArsR family regulator
MRSSGTTVAPGGITPSVGAANAAALGDGRRARPAGAGDTDIAALAVEFADRRRVRILLALGDGRALAASMLAAEAGVAPSTASAHLARLVEAGLIIAERHGRHRYYRLAGPHVGTLLETLALLAPAAHVRSLRQGTRAHAVRAARTCYDHLAGRLGTALMAALLEGGVLDGGDGLYRPDHHRRDRPSAPGQGDVTYRLTEDGRQRLSAFGVELSTPTRRPLIAYCIDWSEQRHHLAGALGAALLARLEDLAWVQPARGSRAVHVTDAGRVGLAEQFGLDLDADPPPPA